MTRFLRLAVVFLLLQAAIFGVLVAVNSPSRTYHAAHEDKSLLLATAPSPRVVLIGGSSVAFGVDSDLLKNLLGGHYSPVNLGLDAGLGVKFQLEQALHGLLPGDIAVVSFEYTSLWLDDRNQSSTYFTVLFQDLSAWTYFPKENRAWFVSRVLIDDAPRLLAHDQAVITWHKVIASLRSAAGYETGEQTVYSRSQFNEYGDNTGAWDRESEYEFVPENPVADPFPSTPLDVNVESLRRFAESCQARGVIAVFAYQPVVRPWYQENQKSIERTAHILESQVPIPFLNDPDDELYEPEDCFDSRNHLRGDAVQRHTRGIANALARVLGISPRTD